MDKVMKQVKFILFMFFVILNYENVKTQNFTIKWKERLLSFDFILEQNLLLRPKMITPMDHTHRYT